MFFGTLRGFQGFREMTLDDFLKKFCVMKFYVQPLVLAHFFVIIMPRSHDDGGDGNGAIISQNDV